MRKILILPFLQIPSGHHQVADALSAYFKEIDQLMEITKIDIFHYTSSFAEKITSSLYLNAINRIPSLYSKLYHFNACQSYKTAQRNFFYERFFLKSIKRLLDEVSPDIIICTHCLPSFLLSYLKKYEQLSIPVINAYTDFFINNVWAIDQIDLHLVPSESMKKFLEARGVPKSKMAVTGIPVHPQITEKELVEPSVNRPCDSLYQVIISGGSLGVGPLENILDSDAFSGKIKYFVLCGKNERLYNKIQKSRKPYLKAIPYLYSRTEMNELYNQMDMVISKPGGITIAECLRKELPLCLLNALPGQEEKNEFFLLEEKLAFKANVAEFDPCLLRFLEDEAERNRLKKRLSGYKNSLDDIRAVLVNFLDTHMMI
ncbi:MGDG synthase family glycosyltransferase [Neobacillus sp. LXY-4]|uniref:MGDG synthase family glycosyltransferase n=1 Tax=Neobacillus sp. LXY-4 TaxID=3379826 RepID=UPI003EE00B6A